MKHSKKGYELLDHEADVGVLGWGETFEEAIIEAAKALFSIMTEISRVEPKEEVTIELTANSREGLFVNYLNELLAQADINHSFFSEFDVSEITEGNDEKKWELKGIARGEERNAVKHEFLTEAKAATYHGIFVKNEEEKWIVRSVIDV
ncbi:MAG: archease [Candidatus Heimdallarchaeota archaeon]|nr:archease [Candidatus Heimdallarchaeota archaeon]MCK5049159.1 archease [Candidatus Heimdallarchaeota archaeon]